MSLKVSGKVDGFEAFVRAFSRVLRSTDSWEASVVTLPLHVPHNVTLSPRAMQDRNRLVYAVVTLKSILDFKDMNNSFGLYFNSSNGCRPARATAQDYVSVQMPAGYVPVLLLFAPAGTSLDYICDVPAAPAIGNYSPGVQADGLVFTSGQIGDHTAPYRTQAEQALGKVSAIFDSRQAIPSTLIFLLDTPNITPDILSMSMSRTFGRQLPHSIRRVDALPTCASVEVIGIGNPTESSNALPKDEDDDGHIRTKVGTSYDEEHRKRRWPLGSEEG